MKIEFKWKSSLNENRVWIITLHKASGPRQWHLLVVFWALFELPLCNIVWYARNTTKWRFLGPPQTSSARISNLYEMYLSEMNYMRSVNYMRNELHAKHLINDVLAKPKVLPKHKGTTQTCKYYYNKVISIYHSYFGCAYKKEYWIYFYIKHF